jgi:hypothetical protein
MEEESVFQLMNESSREERTQEEEILGVRSLKFRDREPVALLSLEAKKCDGGRRCKILDFASGPRSATAATIALLGPRVSGHVLIFV